MSVETRSHDYDIDGKTYEAFVAHNGKKAPGVLVFHAWAGRSPFEDGKAKMLAELGYTGIACDLYGKGILGASKEENEALMTPLASDRPGLQKLLHDNIAMAKTLPEVDAGNVVAIGFCFGGLCVLDIARSGGDVKGVASFHGILGAPGNTNDKITAKVLALHGWDDPMATPDDVKAFTEEMTAAGADWQLHAYGGTMHSFTNPQANDPDFGTVYNAVAEKRSLQAMENFLSDIFS